MGEQTFPTWGKPVQQMQEIGVLVVAQVARVAHRPQQAYTACCLAGSVAVELQLQFFFITKKNKTGQPRYLLTCDGVRGFFFCCRLTLL